MDQKYLFVCGCPRSGTSALVRLLNSHKSLAIGMERYKYYANKKKIGKINKNSFKSKFFFDIQDSQTNIKWKHFYNDLKKKYKQGVVYLGDKYPHYYRFYPQINKNLGEVKWIFIIRDIYSVAKSYNVRAADSNDHWSQEANYKKAVEHWNESLVETWKYQKNIIDPNLFVCEYEKLFNYDVGYLKSMLNFLKIESDSQIVTHFDIMKQKWQNKIKSIKTSENNTNKDQNAYIQANAKHILKEKLVKKFSQLAKV